MLENQEPQENQEVKPELSVEEQLQQIVIFPHNLKEVSEIAVKPMLDILGLEVKGASWYSGPKADEVTIRQEIVKLNEIITNRDNLLETSKQQVANLASQISSLTDYLDENWDSIDEEVREKLCDIFGIDERVTKYVTIEIKGTIEISAPRGYDWDNISDDLNYDIDIIVENSDLEKEGYGFDADDFSAEAD